MAQQLSTSWLITVTCLNSFIEEAKKLVQKNKGKKRSTFRDYMQANGFGPTKEHLHCAIITRTDDSASEVWFSLALLLLPLIGGKGLEEMEVAFVQVMKVTPPLEMWTVV